MWGILYRTGTAWLLQIINSSYVCVCHETQEYKYHINRYYNAVAAFKGFRFHNTQRPADHRSTHSYLVLAGAISSTANSLYQLVTEYKDFTGNTFSHVSKKPFVAWYYADANVAISREIQHCYRLYASVAASGINLMKASMDEKLNLVMTLKASIDRARYIIDNANLYCFLVTDCGWKPDYIWEILNSNVKNEIAERVINKWNQGYAG